MCASFKDNPCTTILSCNSPINARDETDITTFYNELLFLVRHISKHNVQIIGGDMNVHVGKDENNTNIKVAKQKWCISSRVYSREEACMPKYWIPKKGGGKLLTKTIQITLK